MSNTKILESKEYYFGKQIGEIKAWCEAARCEAKDMSLSELFHPEDYEFLLPETAKRTQSRIHHPQQYFNLPSKK